MAAQCERRSDGNAVLGRFAAPESSKCLLAGLHSRLAAGTRSYCILPTTVRPGQFQATIARFVRLLQVSLGTGRGHFGFRRIGAAGRSLHLALNGEGSFPDDGAVGVRVLAQLRLVVSEEPLLGIAPSLRQRHVSLPPRSAAENRGRPLPRACRSSQRLCPPQGGALVVLLGLSPMMVSYCCGATGYFPSQQPHGQRHLVL